VRCLRHPRWIAIVPYAIAVAPLPSLLVTACSKGSEGASASTTASAQPTANAASPAPSGSSAAGDAGADAASERLAELAEAAAREAMALHLETKEELLALFEIKRPPKRDSNADDFLDKTFGPGSPIRINQGNKALAKHAISKAACLAGLAGLTIQTEEQKATCGAENMVPLWRKGRKPKVCIDVFEFPNKPCELPMVWVAPVQAKVVCELQGKRLCQQDEWTLACRGDPDGGNDQKFAYGEELDLTACNTNKPGATESPNCYADSAGSAWRTCSTNTEPAGSFPRCRSRFGVFDQHGNVAEIMRRLDGDGQLYSQLKGSAFFYVDVARKPGEPQGKGRQTYPDHCAHDPRWHVELLSEAWHVNYHLGFRCCKSVH
jgi:formylglycine-generating enzyme